MGEVFRFELAYQLHRPSTLVYFLIVTGLGVMAMKMMANGPTLDGTLFNSPFAVMMVTGVGSMLALMFLTGFAGDAATRDLDVRMHSLFYTSPVGRSAYFLGRFLGAITLSALLMLALPIGALIATSIPWVEAGNLAPFRAAVYLRPYLLFALPNAFLSAAVLFGVAILTRRAIWSYAGAAFLVFFALVCGKILAPRLGWDVAKLLDPLGYTTVMEILQSTNAIQKNAFVVVLDAPLLTNRLLWLAVGLAVLTAAYARFRFAHEAVGGDRAQSRSDDAGAGSVDASIPIRVPAARRLFDATTRMRQLLAIAMRSFHDLHTSRVWWIVPLVALGFINAAPELASSELGVPAQLTTARLLSFLTGDVILFLTLLIALSAGELVWRERSGRIQSLADVTPVPDWLTVAGKFLGLAMMLVATVILFMLTGLAVQMMVGVERYDLPLYIQVLFGLHLSEYLLIAALAMIVHVLVNQKYVANVLVVLSLFVRDMARSFGGERLFLYGDLPAWSWSEIAGFGRETEARIWFTLYYGGWALLFALLTYLFWVRGEEHNARQRLALARRRLGVASASLGLTAVAIIAAAGGFIFYNTHVDYDLQTSAEMEQRSAEFERRYGQYASLPQPNLAATNLHVDFHPQRRTANVRGIHRLVNRTGATIRTIHVATAGNVESTTVSFDRASRPVVTDDDHGYRIYALDEPLAPGEEIRMHFGVFIRSHLFATGGTQPVVANGSFIVHRPRDGDHWLPVVGYPSARELDNAALRKKHGLRERPPYPRLGDVPVGNEQKGYEKIDLETIIGTDAGQLGVAPGKMRRAWSEHGRRYVHYVTDAPISNAYTILSADYAVHRAMWRPSTGSGPPVEIEIFHHPSHTANLERMAQGVQASLDYLTREFGPYPYRQVRLVEYPTGPSMIGLTAHSGLITYAEGVSFLRPEDDPRRIDFPFAVVAHEMAHQWWGHQLVPAVVEGAPFLAESLSWYSGMLVVEETFGRAHLDRLLAVMREHYLAPNQPRALPLLRTVNHLDAYRTGPFAMYTLRKAVGVEPVNRALRNLLAKFPPGREPYPTTLDFYAELRAATPPSAHGLLKDLFEEITFWDLRMKSIEVKQAGKGAHRVTLHVEAQKLKGDGTGDERLVPMNDPIEIVVFGADGESLYRARHRIRSGARTIDLVVPQPPARAAIDPDHELLDRNSEDNEVMVKGGSFG